jgi:hypothetical protein
VKLPRLTIEYADVEEVQVVTITARTEVLWERHFGIPYMSFLIPFLTSLDQCADPNEAIQTLEMDHLYFLGFAAATKCAEDNYEDWLDTVAAVKFGEATEDDAAPLGQVSSGSPEPAA